MTKCTTTHIDHGIYDIEICVGVEALKRSLHILNSSGWPIVTMTQNEEVYTILFRRPCE